MNKKERVFLAGLILAGTSACLVDRNGRTIEEALATDRPVPKSTLVLSPTKKITATYKPTEIPTRTSTATATRTATQTETRTPTPDARLNVSELVPDYKVTLVSFLKDEKGVPLGFVSRITDMTKDKNYLVNSIPGRGVSMYYPRTKEGNGLMIVHSGYFYNGKTWLPDEMEQIRRQVQGGDFSYLGGEVPLAETQIRLAAMVGSVWIVEQNGKKVEMIMTAGIAVPREKTAIITRDTWSFEDGMVNAGYLEFGKNDSPSLILVACLRRPGPNVYDPLTTGAEAYEEGRIVIKLTRKN